MLRDAVFMALLISIHAAQEGCDAEKIGSKVSTINFNPRSPRGLRLQCVPLSPAVFQDFNPRSPRGLRLLTVDAASLLYKISIHAAQEGCDQSPGNFML